MDVMDVLLLNKIGPRAPVAVGGAVIDDSNISDKTVYSSKRVEEILKFPQYNTMVVTAMQEGEGFKSDKKASEIKRHADGGGVVILRFNAPDGSGEQSYQYETYKGKKAVFRRTIVEVSSQLVTRINITIDENYNVVKTDESLGVATLTNLQQIEDGKAEYTYKVIATDRVTQADAREVLTFLDQYDGKLIEFLTNGDNPSKCVATGRTMTDVNGNTYLITYNIDGTTTIWTRDAFEKHNFECRSYINEPMVDLDNFTIDHQGEAPYLASVRGAINKPGSTSDFGVIFVIAYSVDKQIQLYRDIENGKKYRRLVTGTADKHSFGIWVDD